MDFKDEKFLKERSFFDVDAGLVLKVLLATAVLSAGVFYLGLNFGKGELVKDAQGSVAPDMRTMYQRVRQVKARAGEAESDKYFVFPSMLKRSASDGTDDDEVFNSLKRLLPASMRAHRKEMQAFEKDAGIKTLLARYELTYEDLDRLSLPAEQRSELREKISVLMKRSAARGEAYPRNPRAPKELLEEPAVEAQDPKPLATMGEMFSPAPMDDSAEMIMMAPDEAPAPSPKEPVVKLEKKKGNAKTKLGQFTLQLQSFQSKKEAESFQAEMKAQGHGTFVQKVELKGKGTWYRVRLGRFLNMDRAQEFKKTFERDQAFVTTIMPLGD
jgi:cell division septation protein DedD